MSDGALAFGRFLLDPVRRELCLDLQPVRLGSRALDILCILASARNALVTKTELLAQVWPGVVVEENNLHVHISALRKVLDPEKTGGSCIITVPGRGYRLIGFEEHHAEAGGPAASPAPILPDRPALAVLPFQNLSGDPEQEYFADGMVEEITTAIARLPWLFVIARNSSFTYKGKAIDVKQVARELGVRYVLEGSVRKAGNRVRVAGQLIDTASGGHIWADRFEGALDDVFRLQDQVASNVAGAIEPRLRLSEIARSPRRPPENLDAHDLYLRALAQTYRYSEAGFDEAVILTREALAIDPSYAPAAALVGWCHVVQRTQGWGSLSDADIVDCVSLARQALEAESRDADTMFRAAYTLFLLGGETERAAAVIDRALTINPNSAAAWMARGWLRALRHEPAEAIEALERAMRLSPLDPMGYLNANGLAMAHLGAGRFEEAVRWADRALHSQPRVAPSIRAKVVALAHLGRIDEARAELHRLITIDPTFSIATYRTVIGRSFAPEFVELYVTGLRLWLACRRCK